MKLRIGLLVVSVAVLPFLALNRQVQAAEPPEPCSYADLFCPAANAGELAQALQGFPDPLIVSPDANLAAANFVVSKPISRTVPYAVITKGAVQMSEQDFATRVQTILDDPRGWTRLGVRFERVDSGGEFTVVLAQPEQVPSFGSPCDTEYNCNVGDFVVVNEARWLQATTPWNAAGGSIPNYQHLVINHELGHWLGHGHPPCPAAGSAAPVMMQQSLDLGGCKFNAWPRDDELQSTRLGL